MDANANTNITFEQMPQALAEVLSQVRLIKEAVLNGDNSKRAGRGSHVLIESIAHARSPASLNKLSTATPVCITLNQRHLQSICLRALESF